MRKRYAFFDSEGLRIDEDMEEEEEKEDQMAGAGEADKASRGGHGRDDKQKEDMQVIPKRRVGQVQTESKRLKVEAD